MSETYTVKTELTNTSSLDKAETTTQLDERSVTGATNRGIKPPYPPATLASFQELNGTHAVAVGKKAQWEVGFGFDIVSHSSAGENPSEAQHETIEDFWHGSGSDWKIGPEGTADATPTEVLTLARRDYHGIGWAAIEILVDNSGTPVGLAHVPATTVRVRRKKTSDDVVQRGIGYVQVREGRTRYFGEAGSRWSDDPVFVDEENGDTADDARNLDNDPANELIFVPNPSPLELYYGIPDWVAEMQTMAADQEVSEYNREFFEHGTIPYIAITVTNGKLTEDSRNDLRGMLHNLKGKPHRSVILEAEELADGSNLSTQNGNPAEIEIQPLGAQQDEDMAFTEYRRMNEHDIAKVHGVPPILINRLESANRSNSREQIRTFAQEEVAPEQSRFASRLYNILHIAGFEAPDWTVEFVLRGAENREREAQIATQRIQGSQGVMTVNEARDELGLESIDGPAGNMLVAELGGGGQMGGPGAALDDALNEQVETIRDDLRVDMITEQRIQGVGDD